MDEEFLDVQIRKFLKKVGITSQTEIESAIKRNLLKGSINDNDTLNVSVLLEIREVGLKIPIKGEIKLGK